MARIVLGFGTSHTPLFALDAEEWHQRAAADINNPRLALSDGRFVTYPELLAERGPWKAAAADPANFPEQHAFCESALDELSAALAAAQPDVVVIVGDDQGELFVGSNQPAIAIYHGATAVTSDAFGRDGIPDWAKKCGRGYMMDARHELPVAADFALALVRGLIDAEVDVTSAASMPPDPQRGMGHAFGFVYDRLMRRATGPGAVNAPIVPVLLNTYFQPNVPSASRCYDMGRHLRAVIEAMPGDQRVAIVASGGLSHFVVDEELDRKVLTACEQRDAATLRSLPRGALNSGSSEILNWVLAAGALEGLSVRVNRYTPIHRTPAGTGVGAGFLIWS